MLKNSPLIPKSKGQLISKEDWYSHRSEECKWELWDGKPFNPYNTYETDRLLILLLTSVGMSRFVKELLPNESKNELLEMLRNDAINNKDKEELVYMVKNDIKDIVRRLIVMRVDFNVKDILKLDEEWLKGIEIGVYEEGKRIARNLARDFSKLKNKHGLTLNNIADICGVSISDFEDYINIGGENE